MVAHKTSMADVPGSNLASPPMILMFCRIIMCDNVEKLRVEREKPNRQAKKIKKN